MNAPTQLIFLPGASGDPAFWQPMANALTYEAEHQFLAYPGFGAEPADPDVENFEDLVRRLVQRIDRPTALIAQSMGGVLALRAALAKPALVTHLVLAVTSGGLDMQALGASDWRESFGKENPHLPDWFLTLREDLTGELPYIQQPVMLLWGDEDPISPLSVGEKLLELLPNSELDLVNGGDHDLANAHARVLAPLVDEFLQQA
ncbi:alpha/beta hydrolase [Paraburkholderia bannensis]|uniref:TAP-like protein n=1 Tax=Paraburkholderia tropica TaxID=92647 RepID=A0AAQ1GK12_9BURK|nr:MULTISPECIES: alpha/beta hydrolase [Paraburkholderia]RQM47680.1 alpha/beta hydrolase [Paraburkholderia bannensis]RQN38473.1 alpha/beta hydrolase [Paraburkholderia tropica]SEK06744.1 TAP-like protein [Paraburkholderia tropica]